MDGVVPAARRSPAQLPDGSRQELVLLLRLRPGRRCDPLCRTLPSGAVCASLGIAAPMACWSPLLHEVASFYRMQLHRHAEAVAYLHHRGLRSPGTDRARAHRLCAWRLPSRLADMVGLYAPQSVKPVWSPPWDTTPTSVASFFRWKATSMAAVCQQRRRRHRLLPGNRVGCICGSQFGNLRK